jgi:glycosyltransferase involved in cell wall biosynthesis
MNIGIDASRAFLKQRTGTENYSYYLIKALAATDHSNRYLLYLKGSEEIDFELPPNFWLKKISLPRFWTQLGLAARSFWDPIDLLFIPAHTLPIIRRPNLKTVVTIHGLEYQYLPEYYQFPQKLFLNRSTEYAVKQADCLIAVSEWTKKELVRQLGADSRKIKVVYEGVDYLGLKSLKLSLTGLAGIRKKYQLSKDYLLFVGTIQPRKNLEKLIEAFNQLISDAPKSLSLVLAGKLGWMYDKILAAPKRLGIQKRVKFLGHVPDQDLVGLYQGARVFCLPSLVEGFGLPVLEAMALGTPVVAARAGALPEVVGPAGLLINPKKTTEITAAVKMILENPALAEGLREKGLKRVKEFSWQKTARKTLKIFKSLE